MKKENGYEEIEYGGFVKDRKTGKLDLMFLTPIGQLICRNRTIEKAQLSNEHYNTDYDLTTVQVRCRKVETAVNPWRDSEEEADLDSAIIRKENCWYREKMSRENHSKAKLNGICNYRLYTTEELIESYAFESSRINEMDKEIAQKAIKKELKRRFNATLRLLDDEQTIQNPTGTYRCLLNVTD